MDLNELVQAYVITGQKIDVLWNFYLPVHLAIAGFLLSTIIYEMRWQVNSISMIAYLGFSVINYRAKDVEYKFFNSIGKDIESTSLNYPSIDSYFSNLDFSDRTIINITIYILSVVFIVIIYFFHSRIMKIMWGRLSFTKL